MKIRLRLIGIPGTIEHYHEWKPDTSELEKLFNLKIPFEVRIFNQLKRNGIYTVECLRRKVETGEIKNERNLGEKSVLLLTQKLSQDEGVE